MSERSRRRRLHRARAHELRGGGHRQAPQAHDHHQYRRVIEYEYHVHVYGHDDKLACDVVVHDHDNRPVDNDEQRAFYDIIVRAALNDDPALVLDIVADDHDVLRALDKRRGDHHIDLDP